MREIRMSGSEGRGRKAPYPILSQSAADAAGRSVDEDTLARLEMGDGGEDEHGGSRVGGERRRCGQVQVGSECGQGEGQCCRGTGNLRIASAVDNGERGHGLADAQAGDAGPEGAHMPRDLNAGYEW